MSKKFAMYIHVAMDRGPDQYFRFNEPDEETEQWVHDCRREAFMIAHSGEEFSQWYWDNAMGEGTEDQKWHNVFLKTNIVSKEACDGFIER